MATKDLKADRVLESMVASTITAEKVAPAPTVTTRAPELAAYTARRMAQTKRQGALTDH